MRSKYVLISIILIVIALFSLWCSKFTSSTDFASFYRAANIALNNNVPITDIYELNNKNIEQYSMPDDEIFVEYRYSVLATYLISPLGLLDFDTANAAMIFINIICYALSVILILRVRGAKGRWFLYPLALSFLWMPFFQNIRWGQVNAIILLLITLAVLQAEKNRYLITGILLAVATLFKPFVLAVTLVLFLKNWRVAIGFIGLMFAALLLPGTREWLHSFLWPPHPYFCYSAVYRLLQSWGPAYFWSYGAVIGLITAFIAFSNREQDYITIAALAIPAAFLTMPVLEISHPTIIIFTFAYLLYEKITPVLKILAMIAFGLIYVGSLTLEAGGILYLGVFIVWIVMLLLLMSKGRGVIAHGS